MRTQGVAVALAALVGASVTGGSEGLNVWTKVSAKVQPTNERLASVRFH